MKLDMMKDGINEVVDNVQVKTNDFHENYISKFTPDCGKYGDVAKFTTEMVPGVAEYNAIREGNWGEFALAAGLDSAAIIAGLFSAGSGYVAVKSGTSVARAGVKVATKELAEAGTKKVAKETAKKGIEKAVADVAETGLKELSEKAVKGVDEVIDEREVYVNEYVDDVKKFSEFPDTLNEWKLDASEINKVTLERNSELRKEFCRNKGELIRQWENKYGYEWPRYTEDVFNENGIKIRKVGDKYDIHHKKPLSWGGTNEVENITPLHANVHYDHRGVHAKDSAYNVLRKL